jgi:hypothetical protein
MADLLSVSEFIWRLLYSDNCRLTSDGTTDSNGHQAELEFFKFSAAKEPSKLSCQETTGGLPQHPATHEDNMGHHALVGRDAPQGVIQTVSEGSSSSTADVSPFDRSREASISF